MDQTLRDNVRTLTTWLGQVIRENEGDAFYKKLEQIRILCKDLRQHETPQKTARLKSILTRLSIPDAHRLARAFTLYFQLVNLVEEHHRVKKIRGYEKDLAAPGPMSLQKLFQDLKKRRFSPAHVRRTLSHLHVEPVLTAHPTEAKRKTVLNHLIRIKSILDHLDQTDLTWRQKAQCEEEILERLEMLWQTKQVRDRRVRVEDEIQFMLHFFRQTIFSATQSFRDAFQKALATHYPTVALPERVLTFGSWVGGDRDGNPLVLPETSRYALKTHQKMVLAYYQKRLNQLFGLLTSAKRFERVNPELEKSVTRDFRDFPELKVKFQRFEPGEYYRMKLHAMWLRLQNRTLDIHPSYPEPEALIEDLMLIQNSLKKHHSHRTAQGAVQQFIDAVRIFGFHLARLDFRQHTQRIRQLVKDMVGRWPDLTEWPKLIQNPPKKFRVQSKLNQDTLQAFQMQAALQDTFGDRSTNRVVLSMTQRLDDLWAFLLVARVVGLLTKKKKGSKTVWHSRVDVVPLFETIPDLKRAPSLMREMWRHPFYKRLLRSRQGKQEVMLGYSDSNKSGGYLSANYELYKVQRDLAKEAKRCGVILHYFHGKGGSIDRGGGPSHRAVLAAPDSATGFHLRITEQGEVVNHKYGHEVIAQRNLEQMTTSVVTSQLFPPGSQLKSTDRALFETALAELADHSYQRYRAFVYDTPKFSKYFCQATPIDLIQRVQIASRPVFRNPDATFDELRAIPWVFGWTQNRHMISAWYGIGGSLEDYKNRHGAKGWALLQRMVREWPFFSSLMDNAQLSLAKTDLMIARRYATLVLDPGVREDIFGRIKKEYDLSVKHVLSVSRQRRLLQKSPVILKSIQLRNPYVDPLNALQVEYLRLWRHGTFSQKKSQEALLVLLMTVNGIAFGMKSTG